VVVCVPDGDHCLDNAPLFLISISFGMAAEEMTFLILYAIDSRIVPWTGRTEVDPRALDMFSRNDCIKIPTAAPDGHCHPHIFGVWSLPLYCLGCHAYHRTDLPAAVTVKVGLRLITEAEFVYASHIALYFDESRIHPRHSLIAQTFEKDNLDDTVGSRSLYDSGVWSLLFYCLK